MTPKWTRGERVIEFIERHCPIPEGKRVGQKLVLDEFQRKFIVDVYDNPRAKTKKAILSIGRKNGKTALIAGILLAHLAGPEAIENSQIVSGAMSRKQAALVYKAASKMVRLSKSLRDRVRIVPSQKQLFGLSKNVEYEALSAEGATNEGLSPVLAILDEAGQVKGATSDFIDAIVTSQGAYDDAMLMIISTQAASDAAFLSIEIDDALSGEDPSTVVHLYSADKDCDLLDEAQWAKANPSSFRSLEDIKKLAAAAMRLPSREPAFRNRILNQRVELFAPFVGRTAWKACDGQIGDMAGQSVYAGLDLSSVLDLTSLVLIWQKDGVWQVKPYFWTPEQGLRDRAKRDRQPYDVWAKQGDLLTTPGSTIDYEFVAKFMARLPVKFLAVGFDRWRIDQFKAAMKKVEVPDSIRDVLQPFGQGFVSMAPALDALERSIAEKRLRHGGHPVLTMCAANAVVESDAAENRKLTKQKSNGRIDGMVALAMAMGVASVEAAGTKKYQMLVL